MLSVFCALPLACSATDDRPVLWEYISPVIFQPNCATTSCHSRAAATAGLDFSDPDRGYTSLTSLWVWIVDPAGTAEDGCKPIGGTVACQRNVRPLVSPYNPAQSRVVNSLRARSASRMPPDRPLSEVDIRLVERWILNGASKTAGGSSGADATGATDTAKASDGPDASAQASDAGDAGGDGTRDSDGGDGARTADSADAADGKS